MRISHFEGEQFLILEHNSEAFFVNQAVDRFYGKQHHVAQHLKEIIDDVVHDCATESVAVFDETESAIVLRVVSFWAGITDRTVEGAQARWMMASLEPVPEVVGAGSQAA